MGITLTDSDYFDYLLGKIFRSRNDMAIYTPLCMLLFTTKFSYLIPMDENRNIDGLNLREEYFQETGRSIEFGLAKDTSSVFEVMVSLAEYCNRVMYISSDDFTWFWFGQMLENLGLDKYTSSRFHEENVANDVIIRIRIFLMRQYDYYGHGNLFTVQRPMEDMRCVDIATQMGWYLREFDDRQEREKSYNEI